MQETCPLWQTNKNRRVEFNSAISENMVTCTSVPNHSCPEYGSKHERRKRREVAAFESGGPLGQKRFLSKIREVDSLHGRAMAK